MNSYLIFKLLHELAAFWFIAGIVGRQLVRNVAWRSEDVNDFAGLSQVAGRFESLMVIPGNALVIISGILLAWRGGWPIFGFLQGADANWLLVANLILLAELLPVPLIYLPRGKVFDQVLQAALAAGKMTPELRAVLDDPVVKWAHRGEYIGVLVVVALMVLKPF
ncbi:MAG TPA: DUF2269 family protein [Anaerolineae bacterium]